MPTPTPTPQKRKPLVLIIGRENVGKTTLLNRLAKPKIQHINSNTPGTTSDWSQLDTTTNHNTFTLRDTPGWNPSRNPTPQPQKQHNHNDSKRQQELRHKANHITQQAAQHAQLILLIADGSQPPLKHDHDIAQWIRKTGKKFLLIVNKTEKNHHANDIAQNLNCTNPILIAAKHNQGLQTLKQEIDNALNTTTKTTPKPTKTPNKDINTQIHNQPKPTTQTPTYTKPEPERETPNTILILGQPNVGKSTLFNAILKQERTLTSPLAGTTREAITETINANLNNTAQLKLNLPKLNLVDSAGMRKKARIHNELEKLSTQNATQHLAHATIATIILEPPDNNNPQKYNQIQRQELNLIDLAARFHKPILLIVNKIDTIPTPERNRLQRDLKDQIQRNFSQLGDINCLFVSAKKQPQKTRTLFLNAIHKLLDQQHRKIPDRELNQFIHDIQQKHPHHAKTIPQRNRKNTKKFNTSLSRNKIRFITQTNTTPPSFMVFAKSPLSANYQKYLINALHKRFGFNASPIRLIQRQNQRQNQTTKPLQNYTRSTMKPEPTPTPKSHAPKNNSPKSNAPKSNPKPSAQSSRAQHISQTPFPKRRFSNQRTPRHGCTQKKNLAR